MIYVHYFFILTAILFPSIALSHGGGASFEMAGEGYVIDIGYDPSTLVAGKMVLFDLNLWDEKREEEINFDFAWVRIEQNGVTLLATGVHKAKLGSTTLLYKLPEDPGEITVSVRFERALASVAEAQFALPLLESEKPTFNWREFFIFWAGLILGAGGVFLLYNRRR